MANTSSGHSTIVHPPQQTPLTVNSSSFYTIEQRVQLANDPYNDKTNQILDAAPYHETAMNTLPSNIQTENKEDPDENAVHYYNLALSCYVRPNNAYYLLPNTTT
jgi:hypothetical protein